MLKNIKSYYIVKIIFLYVDEKQKLKMVKCSKNLQDKIDISILNYKLFSGKNIKYELNGILKEYDDCSGSLNFEGQYLNGKKHGKGKEYYYDGKIRFEGKYLNGKKNGIGKEYDYDGKLIFDGEYLNGVKHGRGKEYKNGKLSFQGIFLNNKYWFGKRYDISGNNIYTLANKINGKGRSYYFDGKLEFEGEYLNGKRNGRGVEYYKNKKKIFEGKYLNDLRWNGKGYDSLGNVVYELKNGKGFVKEYNSQKYTLNFEGEYINGKRNGKGKEYDYYDGKLLFEGEYLNGLRVGKGKNYCKEKIEYEGEYLYGKRHGEGKEYYSNGNLKFKGHYLYGYRIKGKFYVNNRLEFEGEYLYNKKWNGRGYDENGNIIYELINGNGESREYDDKEDLTFEGEYVNGYKNGKGKEYNYNGKILFEGEYVNGNREGKGKEYYNDGILEFEGEYSNGKKHGKGKEYYLDGHLKFQGEYLNGKRVYNKNILDLV